MQLWGNVQQWALNLTPPRVRVLYPWYAPYLAALLASLDRWQRDNYAALYQFVQDNKGRYPSRLGLICLLNTRYGGVWDVEFEDGYNASVYFGFEQEDGEDVYLGFEQEGGDPVYLGYAQDFVQFPHYYVYVPDGMGLGEDERDAIAATVLELHEIGTRFDLVVNGVHYNYPKR